MAGRAWRRLPAVALAVLLPLAATLAAVVFRVETPNGTLVVEMDGADAEARIKDGKLILSGPDGKTLYTLETGVRDRKIDAGAYKVRVEGADGLSLDTTEFTLKKGDKVTVRVRAEKSTKGESDKAQPVEIARSNAPAATRGAAATAANGFVPLFDRASLSGWKKLAAGTASWDVEGGVLRGRGGTGHLFHDGGNYENFHLRVEASINDGGNSGVLFRSLFGPVTPQGAPSTGYEAQINITHTESQKTGSLFLLGKPVAAVPKTLTETDQWFTLEVIADGPHIMTKVNGAVTASFVDLAAGSRSGRIAFQVFDEATVVRFRNVEIKELASGERRLRYAHGGGVYEQVKGNVWLERNGVWLGYWREHARNNDDDGGGTVRLNRKIEDDKTGVLHVTRGYGAWWNVKDTTRWTRISSGNWSVLGHTAVGDAPAPRVGAWIPLFNGKDTSGWATAGDPKAIWTGEGGTVVGETAEASAGRLLSERTNYGNFRLRMDTQLAEGAGGSLFLRCGPPSDGTTGNKCYAIRIGGANLDAPTTGTLVLSAHFDEAVPLLLAEPAKVPLRAGEWFTLEVIAEAKHLRVLVGARWPSILPTPTRRLRPAGLAWCAAAIRE